MNVQYRPELNPGNSRPNHKSMRKIKFPQHPLVIQLRAARVAQGKTQLDVTVEGGFGERSIQGWENGRVSPSLHNLTAWANALGLEIMLR